MLEVLRGHDGLGVSDVVAVVTRWFGGTLLGAGGLVRAYSDAVRAGLDEVGTRRRELVREFTVEVAHDAAGRLETGLRSAGVAVLDVAYGGVVTLRLGAGPEDEERLAGLLAGLTAGTAALTPVGERWVDRR
jgi:putative IMPACT (imprinted ancient) family translation regulator